MIGLLVKSGKWKKTQWVARVVESTKQDQMCIVEFENIDTLDFDFFVQNGLKKKIRSNNAHYEAVEQLSITQNKPILLREASSLRNMGTIGSTNTGSRVPFESRWGKLCWNSFFMDEGIFPYDPAYDRWADLSKRFDLQVREWQRRGDAVLVNLQVPTDSATNRLTYNGIEYQDYMIDIIKKIKTISDRPVIVRGHPTEPGMTEYFKQHIPDVEYSEGRRFYDDLDRSWCMVTYNSTSAVESSLYGTPTITLDPSAVAWPVSQHSLEDIETTHDADRSNWCKRIAFHQWQGFEMTDGYVWGLLKACMPK